MDPLSLETKTRTTFGKKLRSLRKDGTLPLHVYGPGMESISLQSDTNKVVKILQEAGRTNPVKIIEESGKEHTTLVRNVDQHPATGEIQHVDCGYHTVGMVAVDEAERVSDLLGEFNKSK